MFKFLGLFSLLLFWNAFPAHAGWYLNSAETGICTAGLNPGPLKDLSDSEWKEIESLTSKIETAAAKSLRSSFAKRMMKQFLAGFDRSTLGSPWKVRAVDAKDDLLQMKQEITQWIAKMNPVDADGVARKQFVIEFSKQVDEAISQPSVSLAHASGLALDFMMAITFAKEQVGKEWKSEIDVFENLRGHAEKSGNFQPGADFLPNKLASAPFFSYVFSFSPLSFADFIDGFVMPVGPVGITSEFLEFDGGGGSPRDFTMHDLNQHGARFRSMSWRGFFNENAKPVQFIRSTPELLREVLARLEYLEQIHRMIDAQTPIMREAITAILFDLHHEDSNGYAPWFSLEGDRKVLTEHPESVLYPIGFRIPKDSDYGPNTPLLRQLKMKDIRKVLFRAAEIIKKGAL